MNIDISSEISNLFEKAKASLNPTVEKTVNTVNEATVKTLSNLTETAEKTETTLRETTGNAVNSVGEIANKAIHPLKETASQATNMAAEFTNQTINAVTGSTQKAVSAVKNATDQVLHTFAATGDKAKESVQNTFQTVGNFGDSVSTKVDDSISAAINRPMHGIKVWIDAHPIIAWITKALGWAVHHPIISIVSLILSIFLGRIFIKALSIVMEQTFLAVLQAPGKFSKFIFSLIWKPKNQVKVREVKIVEQPKNTVTPTSISPEHKERVTNIMTRIEVIKQEQNELLQELKSILSLDPEC